MNKNQRIVVLIFVIIIFITLVFPPSKTVLRNPNHSYHRYYDTRFYAIWHNKGIDYKGLLMQDIVILIMFTGIYCFFTDKS